MTRSDLHLIEILTPQDPELEKLVAAHAGFQAALQAFEARSWLSPEEEAHVRRLKRLKLAGRDRIETILEPHRAARRAG
jgi:hypothetical protein